MTPKFSKKIEICRWKAKLYAIKYNLFMYNNKLDSVGYRAILPFWTLDGCPGTNSFESWMLSLPLPLVSFWLAGDDVGGIAFPVCQSRPPYIAFPASMGGHIRRSVFEIGGSQQLKSGYTETCMPGVHKRQQRRKRSNDCPLHTTSCIWVQHTLNQT